MNAVTANGLRFDLREYQRDALDRTAIAEGRGVRRQLGVAATGLGKTVMFCALARERGARTLILAHRDELVTQALAKVREIWPDVPAGIVKAGDNDVDAQVVVASVQTLSRQKRLDQLVASQTPSLLALHDNAVPFDLVIVDEAHHTAADSYRRILKGLRAGEPDGPLLLGVTATPDRGDGKGLDDLFDEIVWNYDVLWGIREGYLADLRGIRVVLDAFNIGDVKVRHGDYDAGAAGRALTDADAPTFIVRAWKQHAPDRRTLVFTPTVALAVDVAEEYRRSGVQAAHISGQTPLDERRAILRAYSEGEIQVLANCAVLTEGYDEPRTDCIVIARPTKSRALYTQMVGRGTRRHPDKTDCIVLDIVGATAEHSLITIPSLLGVEVEEFARGLGDGTLTATDAVAEQAGWLVKMGRMRAEEAELFHKVRSEGIAWVSVDPGPQYVRKYQRTQGYRDDGQYVQLPTVVLIQRAPEEQSWLAGLVDPDGSKRVLISDVTLETAQGVGEDYVRKINASTGRGTALVAADAPWRDRPPTRKALAAAVKWRLPDPRGFKRAGDLSDALDAHIARIRSRKNPDQGKFT